MDKLLMLQKSLLLANPESEHIVTSTTPFQRQHKEHQSDGLSEMHHTLRGYCNDVITKWQDRTQLASGRVSSNKDFIKTSQSVVTQIDHVSTINCIPLFLRNFHIQNIGLRPHWSQVV